MFHELLERFCLSRDVGHAVELALMCGTWVTAAVAGAVSEVVASP